MDEFLPVLVAEVGLVDRETSSFSILFYSPLLSPVRSGCKGYIIGPCLSSVSFCSGKKKGISLFCFVLF